MMGIGNTALVLSKGLIMFECHAFVKCAGSYVRFIAICKVILVAISTNYNEEKPGNDVLASVGTHPVLYLVIIR